jgi:hypothetical protein
MTDAELDKILAAARSPKLDADYTEDFPRLVFNRLRSARAGEIPVRHSWRPRFAWSIGFALFFLLIGFGLGHWREKMEATGSMKDVLANVKLVQETLTLFPNRVRAIVQDQDGMRLVLADAPDVPDSPPLFVKICDGKKCVSLVTFSGQEIQVAGQKITILSDASGGIILEGNKFVWSSTVKNFAQKNLKIEAHSLEPAKL